MIETYAYMNWIEQVERIERDLDDGDETAFEPGLDVLRGCIADAALGRPVPLAWIDVVGGVERDRRASQRLFGFRHEVHNELGAYALLYDGDEPRWVPPWLTTCADAAAWLAAPWPPPVDTRVLDDDEVAEWAADMATMSPEFRAGCVEPFTSEELARLWRFYQRLRAASSATGAGDRPRVELAVERIYASAGLPRPVMLHAAGPAQALMIAAALDNAADDDAHLGAALAPMPQWLEWFCWTHCWRATRRLDDARLEALSRWNRLCRLDHEGVMAAFDDRLFDHARGVFIGALVHRQVLVTVDRHWPAAGAAIRRWLPPAGRPLTCQERHCPGRARASAAETPTALCVRALVARSGGPLGRSVRNVFVNAQFIIPALVARALGVQYPRIYHELLDEWLVLAESGWTVLRRGLAICCAPPRRCMAAPGLGGGAVRFADGVTLEPCP